MKRSTDYYKLDRNYIPIYINAKTVHDKCPWLTFVQEGADKPWIKRTSFQFRVCLCPIVNATRVPSHWVLSCDSSCRYLKWQPKSDLDWILKYIRKYNDNGWIFLPKRHLIKIAKEKIKKPSKKYLLALFAYWGYEVVPDFMHDYEVEADELVLSIHKRELIAEHLAERTAADEKEILADNLRSKIQKENTRKTRSDKGKKKGKKKSTTK